MRLTNPAQWLTAWLCHSKCVTQIMWPANLAPWLATLLCHSKPCHADHVTANGSKTSTTHWLLYLPKAWGAASLGTLLALIPPPSPARIISHVMSLLVNKAFMADRLLVMYTSLTFLWPEKTIPRPGWVFSARRRWKKNHPWWGVFSPPSHRRAMLSLSSSTCQSVVWEKGFAPKTCTFFVLSH